MPENYQALYRKWRPQSFDEIVGQEHITKTLKNEIASGRIGHAYLFCGTRGTGKTSAAKIFSRAVNCENPKDGEPCNSCEVCRGIADGRIMDVYEMDAASNNGVDAVRNLREEVIYTPAGCKYKVYIIDEVHMLTIQAFNALLKTLEEPPGHALFILATTEPQKIPKTILSRCRRYDFRRITADAIAGRLKHIAHSEGIAATEDALELIAELGDGSMRDALSILDRCSAFEGELRYADVCEIVGIVDESAMLDISVCIAEGDSTGAVAGLDRVLSAGKDPLAFFEELIGFFRDLLLCRECSEPEQLLEKTPEAAARLKERAEMFTAGQLIYFITTLSEYHNRARAMSSPRVAAEIAVIKMCRPDYSSDLEALSVRLEKLENSIRSGIIKQEPGAEPLPESRPAVSVRKKSAAAAPDGMWSLWPEVLETIKGSSKKLYMFLYKAEVTRDGDVIVVRLKSKNAYDIVATASGIDYMSKLFSDMSGEQLRAKIGCGEEESMSGGSSIADIVNKKEIFGDIIKVKGE